MGVLDDIVSTGKELVGQFTGEAGEEAATEAARLQAEAGRLGIEEIRRGAEFGQQQLQPFLGGGGAAFQQQQALAGLLGPEAQQQAMQSIQESPGQQFIRERAQRNLLRSQSAIGGLGGGNVRTALVEQGAGFAAQDIQRQYERLAGITGTGLQAAGGAAGLAGQAGGNIAQALGGTAAAQASGILGAQQARQQGLQNIIQSGTTVAMLSDENMKEDINELDLKKCYDAVISMPLKSWRYLKEVGLDQDLHFGVMAQDAPIAIKIPGEEILNVHDEINLIAGALQYASQNGLVIKIHD